MEDAGEAEDVGSLAHSAILPDEAALAEVPFAARWRLPAIFADLPPDGVV